MAQADRDEILRDGEGDSFTPVLGGGGGGRVQSPTIDVVIVATVNHTADYGESVFATGYWATHSEPEAEVFPGYPRLMQVTPMQSGSLYWREGQVVAGMMAEKAILVADVPQVVKIYTEGWTVVRYTSTTYQKTPGMPVAWSASISGSPFVEDAGLEGSWVIPGGVLDETDENEAEFFAASGLPSWPSTYSIVWQKCPYALPAPSPAPVWTAPVGGGTP